MKIWVLTYDHCCELDGVFSSREKARQALKEYVENDEDIRDFKICDEPYEDFVYYLFKCGFENVEAIILERDLDKVY